MSESSLYRLKRVLAYLVFLPPFAMAVHVAWKSRLWEDWNQPDSAFFIAILGGVGLLLLSALDSLLSPLGDSPVRRPIRTRLGVSTVALRWLLTLMAVLLLIATLAAFQWTVSLWLLRGRSGGLEGISDDLGSGIRVALPALTAWLLLLISKPLRLLWCAPAAPGADTRMWERGWVYALRWCGGWSAVGAGIAAASALSAHSGSFLAFPAAVGFGCLSGIGIRLRLRRYLEEYPEPGEARPGRVGERR